MIHPDALDALNAANADWQVVQNDGVFFVHHVPTDAKLACISEEEAKGFRDYCAYFHPMTIRGYWEADLKFFRETPADQMKELMTRPLSNCPACGMG